MLNLLIRFWQPLAAGVAVAALAWFIHSADVDRRETKHKAAIEKALIDQATAFDKELKTLKQITTDVSNGYQIKIADMDNELAAVKRLRPSRCVVPTSRSANGHTGANPAGEHDKTDGVDTDTLYDYSGEAEKLRIRLAGCKRFIAETWEAAGENPIPHEDTKAIFDNVKSF